MGTKTMSKETQKATAISGATKGQTATTTNAVETKTEPKVLAIATLPEQREKQPLSIKDIIERNAIQSQRIEKLEKLNETHKNLDSFKIGSNKLRESLRIADGDGNDFETRNSEIIEKVLNLIKAEILEKVEATENEIKSNAL